MSRAIGSMSTGSRRTPVEQQGSVEEPENGWGQAQWLAEKETRTGSLEEDVACSALENT